MLRYRLLTGPDDAQFCMRITEALAHGWQLYGSPSLTFDGSRVIAAQAVTKECEGEFSSETPLQDY